MKSKKYILAGIIIGAGVLAYELYRLHKASVNTYEENNYLEDDFVAAEFEATVSDFCEAKDEAVASVDERHNEALNIITESLGTIFEGADEEALASDNTDVLNQMNDELNELLK